MLTRIEVDGFKNLIDLSVEFGPLTCLVGPNAVGKSNLLYVIKFLSLLADHTITEAALLVRGNVETNDIRDLFRTTEDDRIGSLRLAAEMIIDPTVPNVDEVRQLLTIEMMEQTGVRFPAVSLSDGTLRFLALVVLLTDSESSGLMCIEEPENGIPGQVSGDGPTPAQSFRRPAGGPGTDNPFRQVIVATHSAAFAQLQNHDVHYQRAYAHLA